MSEKRYIIPALPLSCDVETKAVMKQTTLASRKLGELNGIVEKIPNPEILIRTLSLQEAMDSSSIESIITTHDELYKAEIGANKYSTIAAKEVSTYADALMEVFEIVKQRNLITQGMIKEIYRQIKHNDAGYTTTPGKKLINEKTKESVYTPPQTIDEIQLHMRNLEKFINDDTLSDLDPLVKMAIIHHQFESIHPFGDGNGRAGRVLNILYLVAQGLLNMPILYLSRYINQNKGEYYRQLQSVRDTLVWEPWIIFMLKGVEQTADETIKFIRGISDMMLQYKHRIRKNLPNVYSQDLINNLFRHPYTKIEFVVKEVGVSRPTAMSYLNQLIDEGILNKLKLGRENYYINNGLFSFILNAFHSEGDKLAAPINSNMETDEDM